MKVLHLSQYVYFPELDSYDRNNSGLGYMIAEITEYIARKDIEVDLLTQSGITKGMNHKGINFIHKTYKDILLNATPAVINKGMKNARSAKLSFAYGFRIIGYYAVARYAMSIINKEHPDIVHIHGLGFAGMAFIEACDKCEVRYLVTLHGLIGLDESVSISGYEKDYEKKFLTKSEQKNIPVTVISSGIKQRILKYYNLKNGNNIHVICNGTGMSHVQYEAEDIRKKYGISADAQVLVTIGNVSINKNQVQAVRAYFGLSDEIRNNTYLLILGNDDKGIITNELMNHMKTDKIIQCGYVERESVPNYMKIADLNVFLSLNEGFGLSMIECMAFGVPTVTFGDLDAIPDIYDQNVIVLCPDRNDVTVSKAIGEALNKKWNKEYILKFCEKFSLESMADKYIDIYNKIIGEE